MSIRNARTYKIAAIIAFCLFSFAALARALTFSDIYQGQTQGRVLGAATPALVAHAAGASPNCSNPAVATLSTSGAALLVVTVGDYFHDPATDTVSDSSGNTWHHLTGQVDSSFNAGSIAIWYAYDKSGGSLVTGSSDTFTVSSGVCTSIEVSAWSGTLTGGDPLDVQAGINGSVSQPGSITPTQSGDLIISAIADNWLGTGWTIDSGFSVLDTSLQVNGQNVISSDAYLLQATAGAVNPIWSPNTSPSSGRAITIAAFKPSGGGGGGGGGSNPPVISNIQSSSITSSTATISWTTDLSSDSQVEYGLTNSYGSSSALNSSLVTSHSVSLSGLSASTLYHFRVKSSASGNLAVSSDQTFSTFASGGSGTTITWTRQTPTSLWPDMVGWLVLPYDPVSQQTMIYIGPPTGPTGIFATDFYFYKSTTNMFTRLTGTGSATDACPVDLPNLPGDRHPFSIVTDTHRNYIWLFGGVDVQCGTGRATTNGTAVTWSSGSQFPIDGTLHNLAINGSNYTVASVIDPTHMTLTSSAGVQSSPVVFSMVGSSSGNPRLDLYYLTLNANPLSDVWHQVLPVHTPGNTLAYAGVAYDPDDDVIFIFGGDTASQSTDNWVYCPTGGTGVLTNAQKVAGCDPASGGNGPDDWSLIHPTGGIQPPSPQNTGLVYDTVTKRVIQYGGTDGGLTTIYNQTWAYNVPTHTWTQKCLNCVTGVSQPPIHSGDYVQPPLTYNSATNKVIYHQATNTGSPADWQYDPVADSWSKLTNIGGGPTSDDIITYDSANNRIVSLSQTPANLLDMWQGQFGSGGGGGTTDTTPPTTPTGISAVASSTLVSLSWTASTDPDDAVAFYTVYRNGSQVGSPGTNSFVDTGLTPSTNYSYTISAVDTHGNSSAQSSVKSVTTTAGAPSDTTPPTAPTNLSASAISSSGINLTWTASTDNVAVTGYKIFRGGVQVGTSTTNSYSDSGLSASTNYSYTVSAYDAAGNNSAQSASASATTQAGGTGGGSLMRSGAGTPSNTLGNNGDFYHRTDAPYQSIYGPKAGGAWPATFSYVVGQGCTTVYHIDKDCDGYGLGPTQLAAAPSWTGGPLGTVDPNPLIGPDADDNDSAVNTPASVLTKYGSISAFLTHLGYPTNRVYYLDPSNITGNASDSNFGTSGCSFANPCVHYGVVAGAFHDGNGGTVIYRAGTSFGLQICVGGGCYQPWASSPSSPEVIMSYPGESVVFSGGNTLDGGYEGNNPDKDGDTNVIYDGFVFTTPTPGSGQFQNGSNAYNLTIKNSEIAFMRIGWEVTGSNNVLFSNNLFHDNDEHGIYPISPQYWGATDRCPGYVWQNGGVNPHINFQVDHNIFINNGNSGYDVLHLNAYFCGGAVTNNIFVNNDGAAISLQTGSDGMFVANNVIASNGNEAILEEPYGCDNNGNAVDPSQVGTSCDPSYLNSSSAYNSNIHTGDKFVNNTIWMGQNQPVNYWNSPGGGAIPQSAVEVSDDMEGIPDGRSIKNLTFQNNVIVSNNAGQGSGQFFPNFFFSRNSYPDTYTFANNLLYNSFAGHSSAGMMMINLQCHSFDSSQPGCGGQNSGFYNTGLCSISPWWCGGATTGTFSTGSAFPGIYSFTQFQTYNTANNRGAIWGDPQFADASPGNYQNLGMFNFRLLPGSVAIAAGVASGAPSLDITGTPRGSTPSIGAYEASSGGNPSAPQITSFTATPGSINSGGSSTLAYAVSNATSLSIDNNLGSQSNLTNGSVSVSPTVTTTYTLTATNSNGSATAQVTVTVNVPILPIISSVSSGSITQTGAAISWTTNIPTNAKVNYGLSSAYGLSTALSDTSPMATSHNVTLTSLSAGTLYHYQVVSIDSLGNAVSSNDNTFTTQTSVIPDTTPPAAIANLAASSITQTSALLSFTAPGNDGNVGTAAVYDIRYSTTPITSQNWSSATQATGEPIPQAAGASQSYTLVGLTANTTYYAAIETSDSAGNISSLSNIPSFLTLTAGLTPDVTAPTVSIAAPANNATISGSTVSLTATASDPVVSGATTSGVKNVVFKVDGATLATVSVSPYATTLDSTTLTNGSHIITAQAQDNSGNISTTATVTVTVSNTISGPPTPTLSVSLAALPNTGTAPVSGVVLTATLAGTATGNTNYYFYCSRSDSTTSTTTAPDLKALNDILTIKATAALCGYPSAGTFTAKVIVERQGVVSESRTNIVVSSPVTTTGGGNTGGGSGGSGGGGATTASPTVTNFKADTLDSQVALSWTDPTDATFVRSLVVRKDGSTPPANPTDGATIYEGTATSFIDTNLTNGQPYSYAIFSVLLSGVSQTPSLTLTASPQAGKTQVSTPNPANQTTPSSALRLINSNGTFYLIKNNLRYGITSPGILYSYGFEFKDAKTATQQDLSIPLGTLLLPGNGYLVKSAKDKTVYLISNNQRYAFTSAVVFTSLGFNFTHVFLVTDPELQSLPQAQNISDPNSKHLPGLDINRNGTIYWVGTDNLLHGYPNLSVYNSWHRDNDFSQVVTANAADLSLPVGGLVIERILQ